MPKFVSKNDQENTNRDTAYWQQKLATRCLNVFPIGRAGITFVLVERSDATLTTIDVMEYMLL